MENTSRKAFKVSRKMLKSLQHTERLVQERVSWKSFHGNSSIIFWNESIKKRSKFDFSEFIEKFSENFNEFKC